MFYLTTKNKEDCYGCGGCQLVCPNQFIIMCNDHEGFLYPEKSSNNCGTCNLCESVCPNVNKGKIECKKGQLMAYLGIHKDDKTLQESSSGGVFSGVAQAFCVDDYRVFGVQFGEKLKVEHAYVSHVDQITRFRKSKYVFSDMSDTYEMVKAFLIEGKKVLFTGTPCQIAGLRLYLNKEYEKLLCVDFICRGVPSQKTFDLYIDFLREKYQGAVEAFSFRHKTYSWLRGWNSRNVKFTVDGREVVLSSVDDPYLRGYYKSLFYRPSCYQCKYANVERVSDITMADFWGVEKLFPEVEVHRGCSVILANTKKGQEWVAKLEEFMKMEEVKLSDVIKRNSQLREPAKRHTKRDVFFSNFGEHDFETVVNLCVPKETIPFKKDVVKFIPYKVRKIIKQLRCERQQEME